MGADLYSPPVRSQNQFKLYKHLAVGREHIFQGLLYGVARLPANHSPKLASIGDQ